MDMQSSRKPPSQRQLTTIVHHEAALALLEDCRAADALRDAVGAEFTHRERRGRPTEGRDTPHTYTQESGALPRDAPVVSVEHSGRHSAQLCPIPCTTHST